MWSLHEIPQNYILHKSHLFCSITFPSSVKIDKYPCLKNEPFITEYYNLKMNTHKFQDLK